MTTIQQLYQKAVTLQQSGQLSEAWQVYQNILQQAPNHVPSLTNIGKLLYQQKQYEKAATIFQHLTNLQPLSADLWYRCGMAYAKMEDKKAITCFRKVLGLHPTSDVKARQIAQLQLAKALKKDKQYEEAKKIAKGLVKKNPKNASARSILGELEQQEGNKEAALSHFQKVVELVPENAMAQLNLGIGYRNLEQIETAQIHLEKAAQLKPNWANPYREMAVCLQHQGQAEKALSLLKQAVKLAPKDTENYRLLSAFYRTQGDHKTSIKFGKEYLKLDKNDREINYNLGLSFGLLGYTEGSLPYFEKAFELEADAQSAYAIGNAYNSLKNKEKAQHWFHKTLEINSEHYSAIYYLLFQKMEMCDWSTRKTDEAKLVATLKEHLKSEGYDLSIPSLFFNYFELPISLHVAMNQFLNKGRNTATNLLKKQVDFVHQKSTKKTLNIGYISPDFRDHPVGRLVAELFQHHDRQKVKVFTYFLTPYKEEDTYSKAIKLGCDEMRDFSYASTIDAAQQIYKDGIDILIDLAGHTANNRFDILALQPAPIQTHLIGYPDTTGQDCIQYYLADKYLAPEYLADFYTEKVWWLPSCFVGQKTDLSPTLSLTRKEADLPEDAFVFVGFNRPAKIEPELFQSWMNILQVIDNSVLWLSAMPDEARNNLRQFAHAQGIHVDRLIFSPKRPYDLYLKSHQLADLFLDTWHYSAGSTAVAALSAGLPVLTCTADTNASRMGACIVAAAGLPALIVDSLEDYEQKAIELANNLSLLNTYKAHLQQSESTLLFNFRRFAQQLEDAFFEMTKR